MKNNIDNRVEGFKQIADCLGVSIASVKRWKHILPITQSIKHCKITASRKELLEWREERNTRKMS